MKRHFRNHGFTITELVIALAVTGIAFSLTQGIATNFLQDSFRFSSPIDLVQFRQKLINTLQDKAAWSATVASPSNWTPPYGGTNGDTNLQCLYEATDCRGRGGLLTVYNSFDKVVFDSQIASNGLTLTGTLCQTYGLNTSTENLCKYRYELRWRPICPTSGDCINPRIEVSGKFLRPGTTTASQVNFPEMDFLVTPLEKRVSNPNLYVTEFTVHDESLHLRFSRAFNPNDFNLLTNALDPAQAMGDLELRDQNGVAIPGSVVVDNDNKGFTFIKTGGPFLAGNYFFYLRSAQDGIHDMAGNLLDGNNNLVPGDGYRKNFTVTVGGGPILSIVDFARGAKQEVNLPSLVGPPRGIPVTLTSISAGTTSVTFSLRYNPNLLRVTGVAIGSSLAAGSSATVSGVNGAIQVQVSSLNPLPVGTHEIVKLLSYVPATALSLRPALPGAHVLELSNATGNGNTLRTDSGIHVAAYFGDTNGDNRYSSLDAQRVGRVFMGIDANFGAYKQIDPLILGDVNGDGVLSAADQSIIVSETQFYLSGQTNTSLDRPELPPIPANEQIPDLTGASPL